VTGPPGIHVTFPSATNDIQNESTCFSCPLKCSFTNVQGLICSKSQTTSCNFTQVWLSLRCPASYCLLMALLSKHINPPGHKRRLLMCLQCSHQNNTQHFMNVSLYIQVPIGLDLHPFWTVQTSDPFWQSFQNKCHR